MFDRRIRMTFKIPELSRLALVFATAPLGLIGATGALLISNRPFGFVALLRLIALAGIHRYSGRPD
jgi:multidrug efflux pump